MYQCEEHGYLPDDEVDKNGFCKWCGEESKSQPEEDYYGSDRWMEDGYMASAAYQPNEGGY